MASGDELIGGRYRVLRRLGSGGMATVSLGNDERLDRPVALKRMHPAVGAEVVQRFEQEAKLGASLNHPNVVKVFDVVDEGEQVTIVMEYVDGATLHELLKSGRLEPARALAILRPLAEALDHAHGQGVIHRDIKPSNVLVREDGTVKLADLGVATAVDRARITTSGRQLGSVAYMAPEQIEGREVSAATDVWGLATLAFEALGGRRARTAGTPLGIVHQVANDPPPDLTEVWPEAPPAMAAALKRGMAFRASERPASAGSLVDLLEGSLSPGEPRRPAAIAPAPGEPRRPAAITPAPRGRQHEPEPEPEGATAHLEPRRSAPRVTGTPAPRRRSAALAALGLAVMGIVAVVVLALGGGEDQPERSGRGADTDRRAGAAARESPARAVQQFYRRAARDDLAGAWRLAGPGARAQLGGFASFRGTFATLESIEFRRAVVTERSDDRATVSVATTAVHPDRTDLCEGEVQLAGRAGRSWRIERLAIDCG